MVTITVDAGEMSRKVKRKFTRFEHFMRDMREPFTEIVEDFRSVERENFDSEGSPQPFRPLSSKYALWKERHFPGQTIMRLHDNLYLALTEGVTKNRRKAVAITKIHRRSLQVGVRSPYLDAQAKQGREAVQITDETTRRWASIVHVWAVKKYKEAVG